MLTSSVQRFPSAVDIANNPDTTLVNNLAVHLVPVVQHVDRLLRIAVEGRFSCIRNNTPTIFSIIADDLAVNRGTVDQV